MRKAVAGINAFLSRIGYPLLGMSAVGLHFFTAITAYHLVDPSGWRFVAVALAFVFPLVAEVVVAFFSWKASGSMVNSYSVWVLLWLLLLFVVLELLAIRKRLAQES